MPMSVEEEVISKLESSAKVRQWRLLHALFSFPVMLAAMLMLLSVFIARSRLSDPDMWWHLKIGEIIWNTHAIPQTDLFSYTTNQHAYVPHEWLAQLTIYAAYHFLGFRGIMFWLCLLACLFSVGGYALCWLYSGNAKIAFVGALGIWFFATIGLAPRPQVLGYVLLVTELIILTLGSRRPNWFWCLPPLFAVWVNCHGSFMLGLVVAVAILGCSFFDFCLGLLVCGRWGRKERSRLGLALGLSVAALFVNPVGASQITYPFITMSGRQQLALLYSVEWQPPVLTDVRTWGMFALFASVLTIPLVRRIELRLIEVIFLGLGFCLAIQHERMLFVFGIVVMPTICRLLASAWETYDPQRDAILPNLLIITPVMAAIVLLFPSGRELNEQIRKYNPVDALKFIRHAGLTGRMLNEYVYGGYLIWNAPEHKVFVDGRSDVFEWAGVLGDYMNWVTLKTSPDILLNKYNIDFCILSRGAAPTKVLPLLSGWKSVYSDDMAIIFVRSAVKSANSDRKEVLNVP